MVAIALDRNLATVCRLPKSGHASDPEDSRASNSEVSRRARPAYQLAAERSPSVSPLSAYRTARKPDSVAIRSDFDRAYDVDTDGEIDGWTHLSDLDIPKGKLDPWQELLSNRSAQISCRSFEHQHYVRRLRVYRVRLGKRKSSFVGLRIWFQTNLGGWNSRRSLILWRSIIFRNAGIIPRRVVPPSHCARISWISHCPRSPQYSFL